MFSFDEYPRLEGVGLAQPVVRREASAGELLAGQLEQARLWADRLPAQAAPR